MKPSLLEAGLLCCPECGGELGLEDPKVKDSEILEGKLVCGSCSQSYPILRGIPRLLPGTVPLEALQTSEGFAFEWKRFSDLLDIYEGQFLDWIAPVDRAFFRGKTVLEAGCGKGRHTDLASRYGAAAVVALELSSAVEVCHAHCGGRPNVHVVQGDILRPPLRKAFDYAFSVGVLHHTMDPRAAFLSLAGRVRKGGAVSIWVYGAEGNGWVTTFVNPLRKGVTSHLPRPVLLVLSWVLALPLFLAIRLVYGPLGRSRWRSLGRFLFYFDYLSYISRFSFYDIHCLVFDHLVPELASYIRKDEVEEWFRAAGARDARIEWHNRNSWRGFSAL